jgi:hypothetical protein
MRSVDHVVVRPGAGGTTPAVPLACRRTLGVTLRRLRVQILLVLGLAAGLTLSSVGVALALPDRDQYGSTIDAYARYDVTHEECANVEQPGVVAFRDLLQRRYGANGAGILRTCNRSTRSAHQTGRAYDWMLDASRPADRAKADEVLGWLLATDAYGNRHAMARRLGVMYIIWDRQWWTSWNAEAGWQPYTGWSPHTDHIHFSFSWAGARQQTSFWTGRGFPDVPAGSYYAEPVRWMVGHGITDGYGNTGEFRPHNGVTRAQMAAFLWRTMGEPSGYPHHGFPDVPGNSYYDAPVRWMRASGITDGYGKTGRYEPHLTVTRGEMASFLWRTVGRPGGDPRHSFPDVPPSAHYDQAVSWLLAKGITDGMGRTGLYAPDETVTRAQTSAFLHRMASNPDAWTAAPSVPGTVTFR